MSSGMTIRGCFVALAALVLLNTANQVLAETKVPVRTAVHTTVVPENAGIGPADAPVRSAVLTTADKQQVKVQEVWWGRPYRAYYGGGYYGGYAPYYPAPYTSYYAPYSYSVAPYYAYPPVITYRVAPRRAFYGPVYGGYFW
jgi:hypothetical protein